MTFDDASDDVVNLAITDTGYIVSGANNSSAVGTITQLTVVDTGTTHTSNFTLQDADQVLSGGVSIEEIEQVKIESDINANGGGVVINSTKLVLGGNITSGLSQTYNGAVTLADDVSLQTSTGVAGDLEIRFKGTVKTKFEGPGPFSLTLESEAIYAEGDIGGSNQPLESFSAYSVNDTAKRGQFYSSVTTDGLQSYKAGTNSGDIEFNGNYTTAGGDIELLGEGTFGVVLSLAGDTSIDVGTE